MNKILPLMVTIFAVFLVSGCITDDGTNETNNFSQNGIFFNYPQSWGVASVASPNGVAAVGDPTTASDGNPTTSVVIQTVNNTNNYDLKTAYDKNYATFFNNTGKTKVSEGNFILNNAQAYEMVYTSAESGVSKKYRAVWVQKGSTIYVILCSARVEDYDAQQSNFNLVVNSFQAS